MVSRIEKLNQVKIQLSKMDSEIWRLIELGVRDFDFSTITPLLIAPPEFSRERFAACILQRLLHPSFPD